VTGKGLGIHLTDLPIGSLVRILLGSLVAALRARLRKTDPGSGSG
jgi:hypothetical protein